MPVARRRRILVVKIVACMDRLSVLFMIVL
jgi:hypothetical protein